MPSEVVGAGFGGCVTAFRATEKGYEIGILKASRRRADEEPPTRTSWGIRIA